MTLFIKIYFNEFYFDFISAERSNVSSSLVTFFFLDLKLMKMLT